MAHDAPPHEEPLPPPPVTLGGATLHNVDCLAWMRARAPSSIHAVVTDPPYGMREFNEVQKAKLRADAKASLIKLGVSPEQADQQLALQFG